MPALQTTTSHVLEQSREVVQVGVARLLHDNPFVPSRCAEALPPLTVARVRPEEELKALAGVLLPPLDESLDEVPFVRCVARRVPRHEHEGPPRVEPVAAHELVVLVPRPTAVEQVRLRPPGDPHPLWLDSVVAAQVVLHDPVLDDVEIAVAAR